MSAATNALSLKEQAIKEVEEAFKGHDDFITNCKVMIASVEDFRGVYNYRKLDNELFWEKNYSITIKFGEYLLKSLTYRKGFGMHAQYHDYTLSTINPAEGNTDITWNV